MSVKKAESTRQILLVERRAVSLVKPVFLHTTKVRVACKNRAHTCAVRRSAKAWHVYLLKP